MSYTLAQTLNLFIQGKTIDQIAIERVLATKTIQSHIGMLIENKKLAINDKVSLKGTLKETYDLFKSGLSIDQISLKRGFKSLTIKIHLYDIYVIGNSQILLPIMDNIPPQIDDSSKKISNTIINTLDLYKLGKSIEEIATERKLTIGTIEGHIVDLVSSKEITDFEIDETVYNSVIDFYEGSENSSLKDIKIHFDEIDEPISYFNIKLSLAIYKNK